MIEVWLSAQGDPLTDRDRKPMLDRRSLAMSARRKVSKKGPDRAVILPFKAEPTGLPEPAIEEAERTYTARPSVWDGEDSELLEWMLGFYPHEPPKRILDATVNGGRFWRGSKRNIVGLDISSEHRPSVVGDNTAMPFRDVFFDVVVYDPPHIPNQGRDKQKDFNTRFGLGMRSRKEQGYSFKHLYPPFVEEAYRVLKDNGILLSKIADYIHNHRYQWAHVDFIQAATSAGFCACDCIIKVRNSPIIDPKWTTAHHSRRVHVYWLVFRKSDRCE